MQYESIFHGTALFKTEGQVQNVFCMCVWLTQDSRNAKFRSHEYKRSEMSPYRRVRFSCRWSLFLMVTGLGLKWECCCNVWMFALRTHWALWWCNWGFSIRYLEKETPFSSSIVPDATSKAHSEQKQVKINYCCTKLILNVSQKEWVTSCCPGSCDDPTNEKWSRRLFWTGAPPCYKQHMIQFFFACVPKTPVSSLSILEYICTYICLE